MKLQAPTVGPIVGYTAANQARIWLRGDFQPTSEGYRRCFGAVRVAEMKPKSDEPAWGTPKYAKLPPHFDMTGVFVMTDLKAETEYAYQAGWFFAEAELESLAGNLDLDWTNARTSRFRTSTLDDTGSRAYIVGSCRYLLKLFGGLVFDERGDKVFASILEQIDTKNRPVDALLMIGDQIYADDLNFLSPDTTLDQFFSRYRDAFSQRHLGQLMSRVPTYMVLDDHEIEDNWPRNASEKDRLTLYPNAIHAYQVYQCSHSPLFEIDKNARITGTPDKFWYAFRDGGCEWFVMDARTERVWDAAPERRRMLKRSQLEALKKWLADGTGRAKLIVTSVPFFPDLEAESDDKWSGFAAERSEILDFILDKKIRKVAFLSGDVHCSFSAELTSPLDPAFKVISVVSSSFFWPYPHMDKGDFVLQGPLRSESPHSFKVGKASKVYATDNFMRITVDPKGLDIEIFERKGARLGNKIRREF